MLIRGVYQPNEPDNPIQTAQPNPKKATQSFWLGGGLRILEPEQPNPTREINN